MYLGFNDHELIVTFDKSDFEGKTVLFEGEQLEDGSFLACPLFVHKIYPTTIDERARGIQDEIVGEELDAMMQAISAHCEKTPQKVVFEEIMPLSYVPSKGELIAIRRGVLIVSIEEGSFAGQTVQWGGEMLYNGFGCNSFAAKFVRPPSNEQLRDIFLRGIAVIREVKKSEYPALKQAFRDICDTEKWKVKF